jgi:mannosyltransferase
VRSSYEMLKDGLRRLAGRPFLSVMTAGLILRLPRLVARPLWYDEAFAVLFSAKGIPAMVRGTLTVEAGVAADVHPLLYYSLLWAWGRVFGTSPLSVRGLSLLIGLGVVAAGYVLARTAFGERVGVVAGWALAVSPFMVHYAQEVRMYGLLALLLIAATIAFWRGVHGGGAWAWVAFAALAAAAQYTHNLAAAYLVALALSSLAFRSWPIIRSTVIAGIGALLLYLPWLLRLPSQLARIRQAYWIGRPTPADLVTTLLVYVSGLPEPAWAIPVSLSCGVLVGVLGLLMIRRAWLHRQPAAGTALWFCFLAGMPVLLMLLASLIQPVYLDRAMLPAGAAFLIWIAWSVASPHLDKGMMFLGRGALAVAFVLGLVGWITYEGFPYAPFGELDAYLAANNRPGEVIVHSNKITALPAVYYAPTLDQTYLADPAGTGSDTLALPTQEVLGLFAKDSIAQAAGDADGIWFVIFPREIDDYRDQGFPNHPALEWLDAHYWLKDTRKFGELSVYHYVLPQLAARLPGAGADQARAMAERTP